LTKYSLKEENLIFIISQPRAGSTYLQNLLSNNSQTNTCSEPWILLNFVNQLNPKLIKTDFDNKLAADAFQDYIQKYKELDYQKAQKEFILNLYKPMFNGYEFVIDKTPRYWEILDELVVLFPKSKIIILKRNPIDVAKSIIKTWDIQNLEKFAYYKRDLLLAPQRLKDFSDKHKNNPNVYSLRYEDLTAATAIEVKKLYNWCGIAYDETILDTSKNEKYKGKYGDPYQNTDQNTEVLINNARKKEITPDFKEFLIGYIHYLSPEFLETYGRYSFKEGHPTKAFKDFMAKKSETTLNKELQYIKQSTTYKVGRWVLAPFQFVKKMLQ
tara:strand:+ start:74 stop:1054 length:981 start_codon:yes stop_codon:yes gene_type:complete